MDKILRYGLIGLGIYAVYKVLLTPEGLQANIGNFGINVPGMGGIMSVGGKPIAMPVTESNSDQGFQGTGSSAGFGATVGPGLQVQAGFYS